MGGCCGTMRPSGQKSLPEKKKTSESKETAKQNNAVAAEVGDKTKEENAIKDGGDKVHSEQANGTSKPVEQADVKVDAGEGERTAEEILASQLVSDAMEAAVTVSAQESEPPAANPSESAEDKGKPMSEDEALSEWMKVDTRNALVIDEPCIEKPQQETSLEAAVNLQAECQPSAELQAGLPAENVQQTNEVEIPGDFSRDLVNSAESHPQIEENQSAAFAVSSDIDRPYDMSVNQVCPEPQSPAFEELPPQPEVSQPDLLPSSCDETPPQQEFTQSDFPPPPDVSQTQASIIPDISQPEPLPNSESYPTEVVPEFTASHIEESSHLEPVPPPFETNAGLEPTQPASTLLEPTQPESIQLTEETQLVQEVEPSQTEHHEPASQEEVDSRPTAFQDFYSIAADSSATNNDDVSRPTAFQDFYTISGAPGSNPDAKPHETALEPIEGVPVLQSVPEEARQQREAWWNVNEQVPQNPPSTDSGLEATPADSPEGVASPIGHAPVEGQTVLESDLKSQLEAPPPAEPAHV